MSHNDNKNNPEENPIRKNLDEQFEQLGSNLTPPEDLEKEVFGTLDTLNLFGDLLDMFTVKFSQSEAALIDMVSSPEDSDLGNDDPLESDPEDEKTSSED